VICCPTCNGRGRVKGPPRPKKNRRHRDWSQTPGLPRGPRRGMGEVQRAVLAAMPSVPMAQRYGAAIAQATGLPATSVRNALRRLLELGHVTRSQKGLWRLA